MFSQADRVARALAGRAGHRPDAGQAAGGDARRHHRGPQRRPGRGQRIRRPARRSRPPAGADVPSNPAEDASTAAPPAAGSSWPTTTRTPPRAWRCCSGSWGTRSRTADDGQQAVEAADAFRPDVVLLDIGMPRLNGYEAARRIREQPWGRGMLLVALTGWGQEEDRRLAEDAGFDHHLVKPAEPAELQRLLTAWRGTHYAPTLTLPYVREGRGGGGIAISEAHEPAPAATSRQRVGPVGPRPSSSGRVAVQFGVGVNVCQIASLSRGEVSHATSSPCGIEPRGTHTSLREPRDDVKDRAGGPRGLPARTRAL